MLCTFAPEGLSTSQTGAIGNAEYAAASSLNRPMMTKPPSGNRKRAVKRPAVLYASLAILLNRQKEQCDLIGMTWLPTSLETAVAVEAADSE